VDVSFGTIWEAIARDQPDSVAISEPDRDYTFAETAPSDSSAAASA
jgi:3-oxocholest-4-en-26-oate---CoA ligase